MDSSSECPCSPSTSVEAENSNVEIDAKRSKDGEESRDRFSELPDAIRSSILASLPLREAARTSVLSKWWRSIWTSHPQLDLTVTSLGEGNGLALTGNAYFRDDKLRSLYMKKYVDAVDQILKVHQKSKVDLFRVHCKLHHEYASRLQQWIDRAAAFSVEVLEMTVEKVTGTSEDASFLYTFSSSYFEARNRLTYLHLQRCNLVVPPPFGGFQFLRNLVLECSQVTEEDLSRLFSKCISLERIELNRCEGLTRLKVGSALTKLRSLTVARCMNLETMEISADVNLAKFSYHGKYGKFFIMCNRSARVDYVPSGSNFFTLPNNFTRQLQELTVLLCYDSERLHAFEGIPTMTHLRMLTLDVCVRADKEMTWVFLLTNKCPFLEELRLETSTVMFVDQNLVYQKTDSFTKRLHYSLRVVSISRFKEHQCLIDLVVDLLIHAVHLRRMIINKPTSSDDGGPPQRVRDLLRERAPANVELIFD